MGARKVCGDAVRACVAADRGQPAGVTAEQAQLWQRIETFALDEPGAAEPFTKRLARENGWTWAYAQRVTGEYKRFVFLAMTCGHPVTPSKAVDEAWHLHLLYTRSYWGEFCPRALGRPLHHEPSRGGAADERKFAAQYERTRESYRAMFDEEPPRDIWPTGEDRRRWKRAAHRATRRWWPWALVTLALAGCAGSLGWPLDLRGPEFLGFFLYWSIGALIVAGIVRRWLRDVSVWSPAAASREPGLDPMAAALLAGGPRRVTLVAVAGLFERGMLQLNSSTHTMRVSGPKPADLNPAENAIYQRLQGGRSLLASELDGAVDSVLEPTRRSLWEQGLLLQPIEVARAHLIPLAIACAGPGLGVVKIFVGVSRDRPVTYLVFGCLFAIAVTLLLLGRRPWRTCAGDKVLRGLRAQQSRARRHALASGAGAATSAALAVAVFGPTILAAEGMYDLQRTLRPIAGSDGSSGCSNTDSCGSGGSCGGGGGGGCGGCGGH